MLHLNIIKVKTPEEMGRAAADEFEAVIHAKPACVMGLATGSTPLPLYRELIAREQAGIIDFSRVRSANLDEYKGLAPDHPQSYRRFMQENLFDHISNRRENTIVPDGLAADIPAMCLAYERQIEDWGGVDIQLLGIGHDGHIGFNEPCDHFPVMTHEVKLTEMTREANKRFFSSIDEVPIAAITMGIGTVMAARKIVMIITGADKAEILHKVFFGPVAPDLRLPAQRASGGCKPEQMGRAAAHCPAGPAGRSGELLPASRDRAELPGPAAARCASGQSVRQ